MEYIRAVLSRFFENVARRSDQRLFGYQYVRLLLYRRHCGHYSMCAIGYSAVQTATIHPIVRTIHYPDYMPVYWAVTYWTARRHAMSGPLYTYPTDLTQGIVPKALHSHNDYWRPIPFYSALSVGAVSIEADVWLYNETLFVGHEQSALTPARTFDSLYIQPILSVLHAQNPSSSFLTNSKTKNGVFDTAASQTLYLFVDLKTDGATTFPYVVRALEPLRVAGYLTTYNGTAAVPGPVTVIGTGNTPLDQVRAHTPRICGSEQVVLSSSKWP